MRKGLVAKIIKELSIENCIKKGHLEEASDKLLKQIRAHEGAYPAYSEQAMAASDRRRMRETSIEDVYNATVSSLDPVSELFETTWTEIRSGAAKVGISDLQLDLLELRRWEFTYREIHEATGYSLGTISRELTDAAEKIQKIPAYGLWTVLAEVFHVRVQRVKAMIMEGREIDWKELD